MKQVTVQKIIANGGQKTTALALYLLDQQEILQKWDCNPDNGHKEWRNPTIKNFESWGFDHRIVRNAARLARIEILKGGEILVAPKKGLL